MHYDDCASMQGVEVLDEPVKRSFDPNFILSYTLHKVEGVLSNASGCGPRVKVSSTTVDLFFLPFDI
jgi:hypothetical protein